MILADANVLSESSRDNPDRKVLAWFAQHLPQIHLPAPVLAELRYGCEKLPQSARRRNLEDWLANLLVHLADRIAPFDGPAAEAHGQLRARLKAMGKPCPPSDSYIAAMALAHGCPVATRNLADFQWTGASLINPWNP